MLQIAIPGAIMPLTMRLLALIVFFPLFPGALAESAPHITAAQAAALNHRALGLFVMYQVGCASDQITCGVGCIPYTGVCCSNLFNGFCPAGYTCVTPAACSSSGTVLASGAVTSTSTPTSLSSTNSTPTSGSPSPPTSAPGGAATTSPPVASEPASAGGTQGLPSGAVAGITIGSALIAVSLAGGCYFFCRRLTGRRWRRDRIGDEMEENPFARKELDGRAILGAV